jgi:hypothetical protein
MDYRMDLTDTHQPRPATLLSNFRDGTLQSCTTRPIPAVAFELFLQQGPVIRACQLLSKDVQPRSRLRIEEVEADSLVCGEVSRSHISLEDVFPCGRAHLRGRVPVIEAFRSLE